MKTTPIKATAISKKSPAHTPNSLPQLQVSPLTSLQRLRRTAERCRVIRVTKLAVEVPPPALATAPAPADVFMDA